MPHKIGIYVRVSTEEQAQVIDGSIESQQHRLKSFLDLKNLQEKNWGKIIETYIDDGYSAKDTRRPAYQRVLRDIRLGKINLILVTDISRLSRNIHDFCLLLKELEEHRAKFFSIKEQFDTSTPAGEMMIYNMINLAQFERKQTSERVAQNFHSRALRGLLNGCNPIFGYDKDPTNSGKLIVNKDEVILVKKIFETYLETSSLSKTATVLTELGIKRKDIASKVKVHASARRWTVGSVRNVLTNLAYIGKREINRGNKDENQDHLKPWQRYQIVNAAWPSIIDENTFQSTQYLLEDNRQKERTRLKDAKKRFYLLSGILTCGECGNALMGQTSHGRNKAHRYYGHKKLAHEPIACKYKRFRADDVEDAVIKHLDEILLRAGHLDKVESNLKRVVSTDKNDYVQESLRIQKELFQIEQDIESAFKLYAEMNSDTQVVPLIKEKLEKLADKKKKMSIYRDELNQKMQESCDVPQMMSTIEERALSFKRGWRKSTPIQQKRLLRRLVNGLITGPEGLYTYYVTSPEEVATVHREKVSMTTGEKPVVISRNSNGQKFLGNSHPGMLEVNGASVVWNGGPNWTRTSDPYHVKVIL